MTQRLRVGVIGAGLIAQVMHLNYLRELDDRYETVAICDISEDGARKCADQYGIPNVYTDWRVMLESGLDAVLILTNGSHADIAIAAANRGIHVFTEKPMCFSVDEGKSMIEAAATNGITLMVAYPKRFDPAYERLASELKTVRDLRLVRVTTFETPIGAYVDYYKLTKDVTPPPADILAALRAESRATLAGAIGSNDDFLVKEYHEILLDSLIHEMNTLRSLLGEPTKLDYVTLRPTGVTAVLQFGDVPAVINWVELPGITRYRQEFSFYGADRRLTLAFPSPFLRSAPTILEDEGGETDSGRSWHSEEISSYDEAFKRELIHFHHCVVNKLEPLTTGLDGLRDVALCGAFIAGHVSGAAIEHPSNF